MTKIKHFDRATCRIITNEVIAALKPIADKYGLDIEPRGGTYDERQYVERVRFALREDADQIEARRKREFAEVCGLFGLKPDDYGRTFFHPTGARGNQQFRLVGINLGRSKFPIQGERVTDKKGYKFPVGVLRKFGVTDEAIAPLQGAVY